MCFIYSSPILSSNVVLLARQPLCYMLRGHSNHRICQSILLILSLFLLSDSRCLQCFPLVSLRFQTLLEFARFLFFLDPEYSLVCYFVILIRAFVIFTSFLLPSLLPRGLFYSILPCLLSTVHLFLP